MENAPMHRPMRQASRQVRNIDQLHAIVEACHTVRIGALDEEGMFIVPMSFGYDWADPESPGNNAPTPRLALWVHSAPEGRKAELFNREPRVAIEMDIEDGVIEGPYACAYSYAYRSIMGTGTVHRIQGTEAKRYGLTRIMHHLAPGASAGFTDQHLLHRHRFLHWQTARLGKPTTTTALRFLRQHKAKGGSSFEAIGSRYVIERGRISKPVSTLLLFRYTNSGISSRACGTLAQAARTAQRTASVSRFLSRNHSCTRPSWRHA